MHSNGSTNPFTFNIDACWWVVKLLCATIKAHHGSDYKIVCAAWWAANASLLTRADIQWQRNGHSIIPILNLPPELCFGIVIGCLWWVLWIRVGAWQRQQGFLVDAKFWRLHSGFGQKQSSRTRMYSRTTFTCATTLFRLTFETKNATSHLNTSSPANIYHSLWSQEYRRSHSTTKGCCRSCRW